MIISVIAMIAFIIGMGLVGAGFVCSILEAGAKSTNQANRYNKLAIFYSLLGTFFSAIGLFFGVIS